MGTTPRRPLDGKSKETGQSLSGGAQHETHPKAVVGPADRRPFYILILKRITDN